MATNLEHGYFFCTKNQPHCYRAVWTIENFLLYSATVGTPLISPQFSCTSSGNDYGMKFCMLIFPQGENEENKDHVGAFLVVGDLPKNVNDIMVNYNLSLINCRNEKAKTKISLTPRRLSELKSGIGWKTYISREELQKSKQEYLPNGHITFECNAEVHFDLKQPLLTTKIQSKIGDIIPSNLGAEIVKMVYQEKICSDVKLKTSDGRVFDAHKCVLSVRSPYFKAMFQHPMKENEEGMVDLSKDMNADEMESLLQYIYLGKPPANLSTIARKMFQVGDMQGIAGLKKNSEKRLIGQLKSDNAFDLLCFTNDHGAKELKKAAASQIANSDE